MKKILFIVAFSFCCFLSNAQTAVITNKAVLFAGVVNKINLKTEKVDAKSLILKANHGRIEKKNGVFNYYPEGFTAVTITVYMLKYGKEVQLSAKDFTVEVMKEPS